MYRRLYRRSFLFGSNTDVNTPRAMMSRFDLAGPLLDLTQPRGGGGSKVQVKLGMQRQEIRDGWVLISREIVSDHNFGEGHTELGRRVMGTAAELDPCDLDPGSRSFHPCRTLRHAPKDSDTAQECRRPLLNSSASRRWSEYAASPPESVLPVPV